MPVTNKLVPVAAPITGVVKVGDIVPAGPPVPEEFPPSSVMTPVPAVTAVGWALPFEAINAADVGNAVPLIFATVTAFEPEVVASPLNSAAVIAEEFPRIRPVSVLVVPMPPWLMGNAEARCVAVTWLLVLISVPVSAIELFT